MTCIIESAALLDEEGNKIHVMTFKPSGYPKDQKRVSPRIFTQNGVEYPVPVIDLRNVPVMHKTVDLPPISEITKTLDESK